MPVRGAVRERAFPEKFRDWLSEVVTLPEKVAVTNESVKDVLWLRLIVALLLSVGVRVRFLSRENVKD